MARSIKKVTHDLAPLSGVVNELSNIISELLSSIKPHVQFDDAKCQDYFDECIKATQKLAVSTTLIQKYVDEVNLEADQEGITK